MKQKVSNPPKANRQAGQKSKRINNLLNDIRVDLGLLIVFWIFLFRELLTGNAWLFDDFPYAYYPGKVLAAVSLSKGILPFWNPYSFGGMPFFADPQIAILYPFNLILALFVHGDSLNPLPVQIIILIHFLIASVSCFFAGKEMKLGNFASLIFSIVFSYSSYMVIHAIHMNLLESVSWLPLLFLLFLRFIRTYKYIYMLIAGIIMSLSILAGYPQTYFFIYVTIGVLFLHQIYLKYKEKDIRVVKRLAAGLTIYVAVSAGISAVQVLPTIEFSGYTERINIGYEFAKQGSLHPFDLLTLLVPKIFGTFNWNQGSDELGYWSVQRAGGHQEGAWMYNVSTLYVTLLPLILLTPFIRYSIREKKYPVPVLFYCGFIVFVILFALGGNFFLHKLFFLYVPLFNRFRNPGHVTFIFSFFIALLTACGVNELSVNKDSIKRYFSNVYFIALFSIIVLIFILINAGFFKSSSQLTQNNDIYGWIVKQTNISCVLAMVYTVILYLYIKDRLRFNAFSILLTLVLLADVYFFAFKQNNGTISPQTLYSQNEPLREKLKEELKSEQFRVNMREGNNLLFQRYQGAIDRIPLIEGYNVLLLQRRFPMNKPDSESTQAFDLMNVKYKINVDKVKNTMGLIPNPSYLAKAKMYYNIKVIANDSLLKKYMESSEFDYRKTLVLEKSPGNIDLPKSDSNIVSDVKISEYGLNKIRVEVNTTENGFLFLSEIYYPEWKAYVDGAYGSTDGKETEIYRTDFSLRSVYVEKGKHTVEFIYESGTFSTGLKITIAALALSIFGIFYFKIKR